MVTGALFIAFFAMSGKGRISTYRLFSKIQFHLKCPVHPSEDSPETPWRLPAPGQNPLRTKQKGTLRARISSSSAQKCRDTSGHFSQSDRFPPDYSQEIQPIANSTAQIRTKPAKSARLYPVTHAHKPNIPKSQKSSYSKRIFHTLSSKSRISTEELFLIPNCGASTGCSYRVQTG
jgi:hypothetical protein